MEYTKFLEKYLPEVISLEKEWKDENITYGIEQSGEQYFLESNRNYFYLALDKNKVVAYIICEIIKDSEYNIFPKGSTYLQVLEIYVTKQYRNKKIGDQLLKIVEEEAKSNGIKHFFVSTATKDSDAVIRFYKKNRFNIWTTLLFKVIDE